MKTKNKIIIISLVLILIIIVIIYITRPLSFQKKAYILKYADSINKKDLMKPALDKMTRDELNSIYKFLYKYQEKNKVAPKELFKKTIQITQKYNLPFN